MLNNQKNKSKSKLHDRLALVFLNLVVALATGALLWLALNGFPWAMNPWLPASSIIWFSVVMTALGMIRNNVVLVEFYGKLWRLLVKWFTLNQ